MTAQEGSAFNLSEQMSQAVELIRRDVALLDLDSMHWVPITPTYTECITDRLLENYRLTFGLLIRKSKIMIVLHHLDEQPSTFFKR